MTAQRKTKAPAATAVPQTREAAAAALTRFGDLKRELDRRQADMNDALARIKEAADGASEPLRAEMETLGRGLQTWCEANREAICAKGTKTADLGSGKVFWRQLPPKVSLRGVDEIVAACKRLNLARFVRVKEEPNKEAMLAEPDVARTVAGVSIGSAGEEFVIEPFEAELAGAAA